MIVNKDFFQIGFTIAIYIIAFMTILYIFIEAKRKNAKLLKDILAKSYKFFLKQFFSIIKSSNIGRFLATLLFIYIICISLQEGILRFRSYSIIALFVIVVSVLTIIIIALITSTLISVANFFMEYIYNSPINNRLMFSVFILSFVGISIFFLSDQKKFLLYACYVSLFVSHMIIFIQLVEASINPVKSLSKSGTIVGEVKDNIEKSKFMVGMVFFSLLFFNLYFEVVTVSEIDPLAFSKTGLFELFYYTLVTFSTVGYGDIYPNSVFGMLQACVVIFSCMFFLTIFIGNLLGVSISEDRAPKKVNRRVFRGKSFKK